MVKAPNSAVLWLQAIQQRWGVPAERIRAYLHYPPSYYHLHIHFCHVHFEGPGMAAGKAHLLADIIGTFCRQGQLLPTAQLVPCTSGTAKSRCKVARTLLALRAHLRVPTIACRPHGMPFCRLRIMSTEVRAAGLLNILPCYLAVAGCSNPKCCCKIACTAPQGSYEVQQNMACCCISETNIARRQPGSDPLKASESLGMGWQLLPGIAWEAFVFRPDCSQSLYIGRFTVVHSGLTGV